MLLNEDADIIYEILRGYSNVDKQMFDKEFQAELKKMKYADDCLGLSTADLIVKVAIDTYKKFKKDEKTFK